jgi:hypothetical protein
MSGHFLLRPLLANFETELSETEIHMLELSDTCGYYAEKAEEETGLTS